MGCSRRISSLVPTETESAKVGIPQRARAAKRHCRTAFRGPKAGPGPVLTLVINSAHLKWAWGDRLSVYKARGFLYPSREKLSAKGHK